MSSHLLPTVLLVPGERQTFGMLLLDDRLPRRQPTVLFPRGRSRSVGRSTLLRRVALVGGLPVVAVVAAWLVGFLWLHLPENLLGQ